MSTKACIFPGSFNPFHDGHKYIISQALNYGFEQIIIVIAQNPNKLKNDFNKNKILINKWIKLNDLQAFIKVDICYDKLVYYINNEKIYTIIRGYRNLKDKIYELKLMQSYKKDQKMIKYILFKTNKLLKNTSSTKLNNK